uniref:LRRK2 ARM repeat domain-containing protein n=1 Tax=Guillardia theta TaxID=55529 RepID=A0A7S4N5Q7_GUITH|mmetsp:Transcript_17141/g.56800  ORF Transcript_17141/g.56800 Transcript_17141/m.56800 type:complete len:949 (+) Transcript_17141:341-3187(+)
MSVELEVQVRNLVQHLSTHQSECTLDQAALQNVSRLCQESLNGGDFYVQSRQVAKAIKLLLRNVTCCVYEHRTCVHNVLLAVSSLHDLICREKGLLQEACTVQVVEADGTVDRRWIDVVEFAMMLHFDDLDIQIQGCRVIRKFITTLFKDNKVIDVPLSFSESLAKLLDKYRSNYQVAEEVAHVVQILCWQSKFPQKFSELDLPAFLCDILVSFQSSEQSADLLTSVNGALTTIILRGNVSFEHVARIVRSCTEVIRSSTSNPVVVNKSLTTLWIVSKGDVRMKRLLIEGSGATSAETMGQVMRSDPFYTNPQIQEVCWRILKNLKELEDFRSWWSRSCNAADMLVQVKAVVVANRLSDSTVSLPGLAETASWLIRSLVEEDTLSRDQHARDHNDCSCLQCEVGGAELLVDVVSWCNTYCNSEEASSETFRCLQVICHGHTVNAARAIRLSTTTAISRAMTCNIRSPLVQREGVLLLLDMQETCEAAAVPFPAEDVIPVVLSVLRYHKDVRDLVAIALRLVSKLSWVQGHRLLLKNGSASSLIFDVMRRYSADEQVQLESLSCLHPLAWNSEIKQEIAQQDGIVCVIRALANNLSNLRIQKCGVAILAIMSYFNDATKSNIQSHSGIKIILKAMRMFSDNAELQIECVLALWSLSTSSQIPNNANKDEMKKYEQLSREVEIRRQEISDEDGIELIVRLLENYLANDMICVSCSRALVTLSFNSLDRAKKIYSENGIQRLRTVLVRHESNGNVLRQAVAALKNICSSLTDKSVKLDQLDNLESLLVKTMRSHINNLELVKQASSALGNLSTFKFLSLNVSRQTVEVLVAAMKKHSDDEDLQVRVLRALRAIASSKDNPALAALRNNEYVVHCPVNAVINLLNSRGTSDSLCHEALATLSKLNEVGGKKVTMRIRPKWNSSYIHERMTLPDMREMKEASARYEALRKKLK